MFRIASDETKARNETVRRVSVLQRRNEPCHRCDSLGNPQLRIPAGFGSTLIADDLRRGSAGLQRTVGNQAVLRLLSGSNSWGCSRASNPPTAAQVASADGFSNAQGGPPGPAAGAAPASPSAIVALVDALRVKILSTAWTSVRQLQIACQKQADPTLLTQALPDQVRFFYSWIGIGPVDPSFCTKVGLVLSDISKNMNMSLPPPYFPTPQEMADPKQLCNLGNQFAVARYEDFQVRICPKFFSSQFSDVQRALFLTHELFHEPSFGMGHPTLDVMNTGHCGLAGADEAVSNPYCVTNVIGDLGVGVVL